jgi:PAS domain S-box-containing protein
MVSTTPPSSIDQQASLDQQLVQAVFDHSLDGVLVTVPDGRILAANPAACAILGASEADICRQGRQGFSDEADPRWQQALEERRDTGRTQAVVPMVRADGAPFYAELSSAVFAGACGEERTIVILRDVTARVRMEEELRANTEITRLLLAGEPTEAVLTAIARSARRLADATEAGVVTTGDEPGSVVVAAGDGTRMPELVGRWYASGTLLARVMASRRSVVVDDLTAAATEEDGRRLGLGPAMIAPIVGGDTVYGNLLVGAEPGHRPYGTDELAAIELLAQSAGVALTLARSRAQAERAARVEDQSRIAADLHDSVIQQLFALGLGLQAVSGLAPPEVASRIGDTVVHIDDVIAELRRTIFGLRNPKAAGDLAREVQAVVDEYAQHLGFSPVVTTTGGPGCSDKVTRQHLVSVLREALSNVLRHARATEVEVSVTESADELLLEVADDGVGPQSGPSSGNGLENMARRATVLGGRFEAAPVSPHGTRVTWRAPVRPTPGAGGGHATAPPLQASPPDLAPLPPSGGRAV